MCIISDDSRQCLLHQISVVILIFRSIQNGQFFHTEKVHVLILILASILCLIMNLGGFKIFGRSSIPYLYWEELR